MVEVSRSPFTRWTPRPLRRGTRPEYELALILVGTATSRVRAAERAEELARQVDLEDLVGVLQAERIGGVARGRLAELGGPKIAARLDQCVRPDLERERRRGFQLQLLTLNTLGALARAKIRAVPLKGPLLGEDLYGDAGARPSTDIDLLVEPDRLDEAVAVVRALGYDAPRDPRLKDGLPLLHFALPSNRGLPVVELHWRIHWYERAFSRDLVRRSRSDHRWGRRADPVDEITTLLLYYARDGFAGLRLAADIAAWWDVYGESLPEGVLLKVIEQYPELARALVTASLVADQIVGVPAVHLLGPRPERLPSSFTARRLVNWSLAGPDTQVLATTSLIDGFLTPAGQRLAFLRRQVFLPLPVLVARAPANAPHRQVRVNQLLHPVRTAGRWILALWRARRSPSFRHESSD